MAGHRPRSKRAGATGGLSWFKQLHAKINMGCWFCSVMLRIRNMQIGAVSGSTGHKES